MQVIRQTASFFLKSKIYVRKRRKVFVRLIVRSRMFGLRSRG